VAALMGHQRRQRQRRQPLILAAVVALLVEQVQSVALVVPVSS